MPYLATQIFRNPLLKILDSPLLKEAVQLNLYLFTLYVQSTVVLYLYCNTIIIIMCVSVVQGVAQLSKQRSKIESFDL